jgi:hypothetical protein
MYRTSSRGKSTKGGPPSWEQSESYQLQGVTVRQLRNIIQGFGIRKCIHSYHRWKGKRPLGRPECRWEDNININLAQDCDQWRMFVNREMVFPIP